MKHTQQFPELKSAKSSCATILFHTGEKSLEESKCPSVISGIIDNIISDDKLCEIAFSTHLKRVALLTTSDVFPIDELQYCIEVMWKLHNKDYSLRWSFIADETHVITFTLKALQSCLEFYGKF